MAESLAQALQHCAERPRAMSALQVTGHRGACGATFSSRFNGFAADPACGSAARAGALLSPHEK
jgi:hypothetical protein